MKKSITVDSVFRLLALAASALLVFISFRAIWWFTDESRTFFHHARPTYLYFAYGFVALSILASVFGMLVLSIMIPACYYERYPFIRQSSFVIRFYGFLMDLKMQRPGRLRYSYAAIAAVLGTAFSLFAIGSETVRLVWAVALPLASLALPLPMWRDVHYYSAIITLIGMLSVMSILPVFNDGHYLLTIEPPLIIGFVLAIYPSYRIMRIMNRLAYIDDEERFYIFRLINILAFLTFCVLIGALYFYPVLRATNIYFDRSVEKVVQGPITAKLVFTGPTDIVELNIDGKPYNAILRVSMDTYRRRNIGDCVSVRKGLFGWHWVETKRINRSEKQ